MKTIMCFYNYVKHSTADMTCVDLALETNIYKLILVIFTAERNIKVYIFIYIIKNQPFSRSTLFYICMNPGWIRKYVLKVT